jgi:enoyl-CoA hydratase/carnithine racemase|tara:strand:- start:40799 stop:41611 length:813 start_codon:yes stop_codon:yes gene_type:complete
MNEEVKLEFADGIAVITLNRPEAYNTMTNGIIEGLGAAYRRCDEDDDVRVVVVTGAGKAFCAGADMSGAGSTFDGGAQNMAVNSCPLSMQAWDVRKPVIVACNGHAVGAGLGLAMQADMRVFANEGKYGFLQSRRGVVADFAIEYILPRLVGFERAFELLVRAPRLSGEEAQAWGLAGRSVPAKDVLATALEIARDICANCAPLAVGLHKQLLWRSLSMSLEETASLESRALNHTMSTPDAVEGGVAYMERRAPNWSASINKDWPDWLKN